MTTHACPATGCERRVSTSQLACRAHWVMVTPATRSRVWDAYKRYGMGTLEHMAAITDAVQEIHDAQYRAARRQAES